MSVDEKQVADILVAIANLGGRMDGLAGRLDGMESARSLARVEQDEWKREIRGELSDIKEQTTQTNGRLTTLELWRAKLNGVASVFAWWKTAVATLIVAGIVYAIAWIAASQ